MSSFNPPIKDPVSTVSAAELFLRDLATTQSPLSIDTLSENTPYCCLDESDGIRVDFTWNESPSVLANRQINPLEIGVIIPLIQFMNKKGFEFAQFNHHDYRTGHTAITFSSIKLA